MLNERSRIPSTNKTSQNVPHHWLVHHVHERHKQLEWSWHRMSQNRYMPVSEETSINIIVIKSVFERPRRLSFVDDVVSPGATQYIVLGAVLRTSP
jgi:hypothetical protein